MSDAPRMSPVGEAMVWVSRITAIGLTMFLPGVAGSWLDERIGTGFLGPVGLVLGLGSAISSLVLISRRKARGR